MARYLIDASTLIDHSRGIEPVRSRLLALHGDGHDLGICAIQATEFFAGLPPPQQPNWDGWPDGFQYWGIPRPAAQRAGAYRYVFARQGQAISVPDALIAGLARHLDATIITDNLRHFPMTDVRLLSLRA